MEQATDDIRQELWGLLADAREQFSPYLQHASSDPLNQWKELNQSKRWSALFLFKDGNSAGEMRPTPAKTEDGAAAAAGSGNQYRYVVMPMRI